MSELQETLTPYQLLQERRSDVPESFSLLDKIKVNTADLDPPDLLGEFKTSSKFPLFQLYVGDRRYQAVKPIIVHVYRDEEWFFAENESLNLTGSGSTIEEAVHDLEEHIVHFWYYYRSLSDRKLVGDAVRLKRVYSDHLLKEIS